MNDEGHTNHDDGHWLAVNVRYTLGLLLLLVALSGVIVAWPRPIVGICMALAVLFIPSPREVVAPEAR